MLNIWQVSFLFGGFQQRDKALNLREKFVISDDCYAVDVRSEVLESPHFDFERTPVFVMKLFSATQDHDTLRIECFKLLG